eukprot:gene31391-6550_t
MESDAGGTSVAPGYTSGIASNLPLSNVPTQTLRTGRTTRPTQKVKETYGLAQSLRKRSRRRAGTLANQNISPSQDQPDQLVRVLFPVPLPGLSSGPVLVPELTEFLQTSAMTSLRGCYTSLLVQDPQVKGSADLQINDDDGEGLPLPHPKGTF